MTGKKKMGFVLVIMVLMIITGCSQNRTSVVVEEDPVTLRVMTMFGGTDKSAGVYETIKEEYQKTHRQVLIEDESRTADEEWKSSVAADFCAGNEPDVIQFFTDATADQLVATGKFVSIEEIREEYPEYAKDTKESAMRMAANTDGIQRAVPTTGYWEGLYCNKDLFEQYGIPLPDDWDSFLYAVRKFRKNDIVPVACSLNHVPHYWIEFLLLYTAGEDGYKRNYTTVPDDWVKGIETFRILRQEGAFPDNTDTVNNDYVMELFQEKKAAMILEGSWSLSGIRDQENTVVIAFPGVKDQKAEKGSLVGGMTTGFYITRRAWNHPQRRQAAVDFVMANTCGEAVQRYWECTGTVTVAATEVTAIEQLTPLAQSAKEYTDHAGSMVLPTDARMNPAAYATLVSGILNVSEGGSAEQLLDEVFEENQAVKKRTIQQDEANDRENTNTGGD